MSYKVHGAAPHYAHLLGNLVKVKDNMAVLAWHLNPNVLFCVAVEHLVPTSSF